MKGAPWYPANNGSGPRMWFLYRDAREVEDRYHWSKGDNLVRYASFASARRAADRLNRLAGGADR